MDSRTSTLPKAKIPPKQITPFEPDASQTITNSHVWQGHRTVPMKVLVLGLSRTGTLSIRQALFRLGYFDVYHGTSYREDDHGHAFWLKAIRAKYEGGPPMTRDDWDHIFGNYMAVSDQPCAMFADELIKAYPESLVVLSTRDSASVWKESMQRTVAPIASMMLQPTLLVQCFRFFLPHFSMSESSTKWMRYSRNNDVPWDGLRIYDDHNAWVKRLVPKERLLEFNAKQGWKPLCKFLGHEVPDEAFPRVNDEQAWNAAMQKHRRSLGRLALLNMAWTLGGVVAAVVGVWIWAKRM